MTWTTFFRKRLSCLGPSTAMKLEQPMLTGKEITTLKNDMARVLTIIGNMPYAPSPGDHEPVMIRNIFPPFKIGIAI